MSVNLHPENYRNRKRQSRQAVMLSNDDQGIELTDFDDMMDWVGDWAPEFGLLGTILDSLSYFMWAIKYRLSRFSQYFRRRNKSSPKMILMTF